MNRKALQHRTTGDRMIVHVAPDDSRGAVFRFEYLTQNATPEPGDHLHSDQEERVEVLSGTLHCRIDGRERVLHAGEAVVIPPGVAHAVWNADAVESRSIGEFRPALDTMAMLEAYFAG